MWFLSAKKEPRQELETERGRKEGEELRRKSQFFDTFLMELDLQSRTYPLPFHWPILSNLILKALLEMNHHSLPHVLQRSCL